jgi:probable HAF family extracellular repeat protein
MVNLGNLGAGYGFASGVNDLGEVVGASTTAAGDRRGFHWTQGDGMVELATLANGDTAEATDIGNLGTIVGWSTNGVGNRRAVQWVSPAAASEDLGTLGGGWSVARGVNAAATIVGEAATANGEVHAFRRVAGGPVVDLGTLGGPGSRADAINGGGHAVGRADLGSGEQHAAAWWTYTYNDAIQCNCDYPDMPWDPGSLGGFRVVIKGTRELDVSRVDVNTLSLGDGVGRDTRVAMHRGHLAVQRSDVNGDGLTDLTVWFDERALVEHGDLTPETRTVILLGALTDRSNGIWGASDVQIVR